MICAGSAEWELTYIVYLQYVSQPIPAQGFGTPADKQSFWQSDRYCRHFYRILHCMVKVYNKSTKLRLGKDCGYDHKTSQC